MDWTWLLIGLLGLLVGGIVWALLAYSAEEEARAAETWRLRSSAHRATPLRGPWDDDAEGRDD